MDRADKVPEPLARHCDEHNWMAVTIDIEMNVRTERTRWFFVGSIPLLERMNTKHRATADLGVLDDLT